MDSLQELALDMKRFLESSGEYGNFLDWAEELGYDRAELETDMENLEIF